ncbi:MAG: glycosyl hydrolase [Verrucomicrobiales bacterium]|nr:glycosyl hydrolase [Verrucomicrobiales bacterium]
MKKLLLTIFIVLAPALCAEGRDWVTLYNGKDLTGWQTTGNWLPQKDGSLLIKPRKGEKGWQRYSAYLWSKKKYKDFVLHVEYKYPPKGNSGVHFRVGDLKNPVNTGIEAQVLDSYGKKKMGHHDHGGIIRTVGASKNMSKKAGEWNTMILTCKGHHLKVQLNGEQIVDIHLDKTPMKDRPLEGHIGLQDHGEPNNLHFRNIKIKEL